MTFKWHLTCTLWLAVSSAMYDFFENIDFGSFGRSLSQHRSLDGSGSGSGSGSGKGGGSYGPCNATTFCEVCPCCPAEPLSLVALCLCPERGAGVCRCNTCPLVTNLAGHVHFLRVPPFHLPFAAPTTPHLAYHLICANSPETEPFGRNEYHHTRLLE